MSAEAAIWAGKQKPAQPSHKLVLWALADHANADGECFPSIAAIIDFTGLNRKTVIGALDALGKAGLASDTGRRRGRTQQIKVWSLALERVPKTEQSLKRNGSTFTRKESLKRDTEPPKEPIPQKTTSSSGRKPSAPPPMVDLPDLPMSASAEQWNDFVEMRRAMERGPKKRPWTHGAAKGIIRDLHKIEAGGGDAGAALEMSTANGWAGVLFNKGSGNGNRSSTGGAGSVRRPDTTDAIFAARRNLGARKHDMGG